MRRFLLALLVLAGLALATGPAQAATPRATVWAASLGSTISLAATPLLAPTDHVSPEKMQCLEMGMQRPGDH